jgi:hypothetical protein
MYRSCLDGISGFRARAVHFCKPAVFRVEIGFTVDSADQLLLCILVRQCDTLGSPVLVHSRISDYGPDGVFVPDRSVERLEEDDASSLTTRKPGFGSFVKRICFPFVIE